MATHFRTEQEEHTSVRHSPEAAIRIAVIERNPVDLDYLCTLVGGAPGVVLTDAYSSLVDALAELKKSPPDLVIADIEGANSYVAAWLKQLHTSLPHTAVLVLSNGINRDRLFATLEAGVSGWLQKPCTADQILRAIGMLREGGAILSSSVAGKILKHFQARRRSVSHLSPREREVLRLLGEGLQVADMAERLGLRYSEVRAHIRTILLKLKANSRAEAVAKYLNPSA